MISKAFNNIDFYKKAIDGSWLRHQAISQNIANVNTPEYKRKLVTFEDQLKDAMGKSKVSLRKTNEKHISKGTNQFSPKLLEDKSTSYRIDGNNVNIDTESAELAKNDIMYNAMVNQVISEFEKIKNVIAEGSK
ncbi:MAG: flagellar basal body rod protein FlgB [Tissierellaceae bacterium]